MKTDISPVSVDVYFIPVETRVPLKFGTQVVTHVTCVRVCVTVANKQGQKAQGENDQLERLGAVHGYLR